MRAANVLYKGELAGVLTQKDDGRYVFSYFENWLVNQDKPAVSLTLPKSQKEYISESLFPFFYHLLPEGMNKKIVCKKFKIDESDAFGILLNTAKTDTVGAVTIERI